MAYDNTNRGVLFRNDCKESDKHPDYKGSITLEDGIEYYLDAWLNESQRTGRKYMSLKIGNPKQGNGNNGGGEQPPF